MVREEAYLWGIGLMKFIKEQLPWIASTAALTFVGIGYLNNGVLPFGTNTQPAEAPTQDVAVTAPIRQIVEPQSTLDEIAALTPAAPTTTAQELTAIIASATTPEVTRSVTLEPSIAPIPDTSPEAQNSISLDFDEDETGFFAAIQPSLAANDTCGEDLIALASVARVYFPNGGFSPADAGLTQARLLGKILTECPGYIVQVSGHSDGSGNPQVNLALSTKRAEAVVARIAAEGIDTSRLVAIGQGDAQPANVQGIETASYYDQRVEFAVVVQD